MVDCMPLLMGISVGVKLILTGDPADSLKPCMARVRFAVWLKSLPYINFQSVTRTYSITYSQGVQAALLQLLLCYML